MRSRILLVIAVIAGISGIIFYFRSYSANVLISNPAGDQRDPKITSDGLGGVIVAWTDGAKGLGVRAQRLNGRGRITWVAGGVSAAALKGDEREPEPVLAAAGGQTFIGWTVQESNQLDLYAQKLDRRGKRSWRSEGILLAGGPGDQRDIQPAADGKGGLYAVYTDYRVDQSAVRAQHLDKTGRALWGDGTTVGRAGAYMRAPRLMVRGTNLYIAWEELQPDTTTDLRAQKLDADGRRLWGENGVALTNAPGFQEDVRLAGGGRGELTAVWEDQQRKSRKVYAQRLDKEGRRLWAKGGTAVASTKGNQWHPELAIVDNDQAIIVWKDQRRGEDDIYAQRLDRLGRRRWGAAGLAVSTAPKDQDFFKVAAAGDRVHVVWRDARGQSSDIYAQIIKPAGKFVWPDGGLAISAATGRQQDPQVAVGRESAFFVWSDFRADRATSDIYGRMVGSSNR